MWIKGKVRDIFLSKEKNSRGKGNKFAFVHFEAMEEALKVAKKTNGMHVYGWPIATKVVTFGWSRRNVKVEKQRSLYMKDMGIREGDYVGSRDKQRVRDGGRWSKAVVTQSRLVWVKCRGIPLSCWNQSFFNKVGWLIGEPVLVEKDTLRRNHLDRGRLLVLVPQAGDVLCKVKVSGNQSSFVVNIEEESVPVDM
ncbi:hypothetical protein Ddye_008536 [Dipteronia dyeriana]|uniref:RRM domain-containing protein n=1 Tax=Dipteronia dyeriana TaxID=168575 RepID=A0AAD9X9W1_9ROSI|nr:hypothetical protein Ddye_008536 [Dipteronia dyeriana]